MNYEDELMAALALSLQEEQKRQETVCAFPFIRLRCLFFVNSCNKQLKPTLIFTNVFEYQDNNCNMIFLSKHSDIQICPYCYQENATQIKNEYQTNLKKTSQSRSICVKATVGSLLNYKSDCLLHCGISDSNGMNKFIS